MSWYKTGTVTVTNGSPTVVGAGTLWNDVGTLNPGDVFKGVDGKDYEILSFQSNTGLTLASNYLGTTLAGQAYAIVPIGLLPSALALAVQTTLTAANAALVGTVSTVAAQGLSAAQQNAARANILALGAVDVGAGYLSKSVAGGAEVTLTATEAKALIINTTGVLTANINVVVPAAARVFLLKNSTTGAYTLTVKTPAGTGVVVPSGSTFALYSDGTNVEAFDRGAIKAGTTINSGVSFADVSVANNGTLDIPTATGGTYLASASSSNGALAGAVIAHNRNAAVAAVVAGPAFVACTLAPSGTNIRFTNLFGSALNVNFGAIRIA